MGTWGPGIWENDSALDYLGTLGESFKTVIDRELQRAKTGDTEAEWALAGVAVLRVLVREFDTVAYCLTKPEVRAWQDKYLQWHDDRNPDEKEDPFRKIAEQEFAALIELVEEEHERPVNLADVDDEE